MKRKGPFEIGRLAPKALDRISFAFCSFLVAECLAHASLLSGADRRGIIARIESVRSTSDR
jgi:hypothetical protein